MNKAASLPLSMGTSLLAGVVAKKLFAALWKRVDSKEHPQPEHRNAAIGKLALALVLEGAVTSLVKGLADHGSKHAVARATGSWPGDEAPQG